MTCNVSFSKLTSISKSRVQSARGSRLVGDELRNIREFPLMNPFRRWLRSNRRTTPPIRNTPLSLERLDDRLVPAVGISASGGIITVTGTDGADIVTVQSEMNERTGKTALVVSLTHDGVTDTKTFGFPSLMPTGI